jgi:hypothetical protein
MPLILIALISDVSSLRFDIAMPRSAAQQRLYRREVRRGKKSARRGAR